MAADGKVVIDVVLDDGKVVKGVANIDKGLGGVERSGGRAAFGIKKLVGALGLVALASKGIQMVTSALDGAISRYDTLNSFPLVMEQIGFSSQDADKAIQRLSEGIDGLPTTLDSVASTAQRIATMTNDLDGAVETTLALNNAFISSGASQADAARGLDQYVQMLSKGEVDLQSWRTLQETMGVALNDTAKAFGFAGKSAQNDLYDALKEGEITFDDFNAKIIELSNAQDGFADRALTSSGGIRTAWTNVKTAVVKGVADVIGSLDEALGGVGSIEGGINKIKGGIKTFFSMVSSNMPAIVDFFRNMKDIIVPLAPLIAGVVASIASFAGVVAVTNSVKNGITAVKDAFDALKLAFVTNPIGLVIAAIVGLIAVLVIAYQKSETFRNIVDTAFNAIKDVVMTVVGAVSDFILQIWGFLVNWWQENNELILSTADIIWNKIQSVISSVMDFIVPFLKTAWENISTIIQVVWETIKLFITNALTLITGIIKAVMQVINGDWSGAWQTIKETFTKMWNNMKDFAKTVTDKIRTQIKENFQKVKQHITDLLAKAVTALINKFKEMVTNARNKATEILNAIRQKFQDIVDAISGKMGDALGKVTEIGNSILSFFSGINLFDSGKAIIQSAIDGIVSMKDKILGQVEKIVGAVRDFWPFSPAKRGPLSDIDKMDFAGPISDSVKKAKQPLLRSTKELAGSVNDSLTPKASGFVNRLRGVTAPIGNVVPSGSAFGGNSVTNNNYSNNYDDAEVKSLLRQIAEKDSNLYVGREKLGEVVDHEQARRTGLFGRRVAFD